MLRAISAWLSSRLWLVLPLLALPAVWPFYSLGLPHSADGPLHLLRLALLDHHVRQGVLYPRWVPELVVGYGYPVFNFYGPSTYYLGELLQLLGIGLYEALMGAFALMIVVAGAGAYALARDIFDGDGREWAAVLVALAYMYAPYLLTNAYVRGAIAEVGAQALLPWIFWSVRRLMLSEEPARYVLPTALSLGGLAITHNITLLFTPPVVLGYVAALWWDGGRDMRRLRWVAAGLVAAMGMSAFFWLPLGVEQRYLSDVAYDVSIKYLPENFWTVRNFLDTTLRFDYTFSIPFQLGLVQIMLAAVGAVLLLFRRRNAEWVYLLVLALVCALGIAEWTKPIWLNTDVLLIAQFPWRLLTFMTLPLPLFTGGVLVWLPAQRFRPALVVTLVGVFILANMPRVGWMEILPTDNEAINLPAVAQFEVETGGLGTSSAAEFRPRWSESNQLRNTDDLESPPFAVTVERAGPFNLEGRVASETGGPLRFTTFFFPGWRVVIDGETPLTPYPSTNLGLLTVDVPAGEHTVRVEWVGTTTQRLATMLSLLSLLALVGLYWRRSERRLMLVPALLLIVGLTAAVWPPPVDEVRSPVEPVEAQSVELQGYRVVREDPRYLYVYPYWLVHESPPASFEVQWQLLTPEGDVVSDVTAIPYFDSLEADNWPPNTLVDDAYRLALPPGLSAGTYELAVQLPGADEPAVVGQVSLDHSAPTPTEPRILRRLSFGDEIQLAGYDLTVAGEPVTTAANPPLVRAGATVEYTLYWRALQDIDINYHGFVHLLGTDGKPLAKHDQLPGTLFRAPRLWDTLYLQPDTYRLPIPSDAQTGLYRPQIGLYNFDTLERLPATTADDEPLGDSAMLEPIKVLGRPKDISPEADVGAQFGEMAVLRGYDISMPADRIEAGSSVILTLYYEATQSVEKDYKRFVHVYNSELGMAVQSDGHPQAGANPTWAWVPGEVVVDRVRLQVPVDATSGEYVLRMGFYDPVSGARVPVRDAGNRTASDDALALTRLRIVAP